MNSANAKRMGTLLGVTLAMAACEGPAGPAGPMGERGEPGAVPALPSDMPPVEKMLLGLGGRDAVRGLASLAVDAEGARWVPDEGYHPEDEPSDASTFSVRIEHDVANDRLRLDYTRRIIAFGLDARASYSEIVRGDVGAISGSESLFGVPGGAMTSERWAATRKQHRLLHPVLIAQEIAANASIATDAGVDVIDGALHHVLEVADPIHPIALYVNAATGRITRVATIENEHLRADVELDVHFGEWSAVAGSALVLPKVAALALDGHVVHEERRTAVTANPTLDPARFDLPEGASPAFDAAGADRGARTHQFHEIFSSIGIPLDAEQTFVMPVELAPGIHHVRGGSHHSLVVEQANGIVVVEAPLYPARSEALIAWITSTFPSKPITHVIATHFHGDHSGGLRSFVARGATIVVGAAAAALYRDVFRAPRTIVPDALAQMPRPPRIVTVPPGERFTIADAARPVSAIAIDTVHAADMLIGYVAGANVMFVSDIYSPGQPTFSTYTLFETREAIRNANIAVDTIAGGHGTTTATVAELEAAIAAGR